MKVGRLLHRRLPRAELVAARETAIDAKKIRAPRLAVGRREAIERRERNADHRIYDVLRAANPLKEIAARPSDIRLHRGAIAVNGHDMTLASVRDFKQTLADAKGTGVLFIIVQRRGAYRKLDAKLEAYPQAQVDKIIKQHLLQNHSAMPQVQTQTSSAAAQQP